MNSAKAVWESTRPCTVYISLISQISCTDIDIDVIHRLC